MEARRSRVGSGISISAGICLLAIAAAFVGFAALAPPAHAADFRAVLCAANNGSNGFGTTTNTTSPQNPGGIFNFENHCGPAPFPAGEAAFLRIDENQSGGNAGDGAYGDIYYDTPPFVHFREAGGYTREPNAFNEGWRGRFWIAGGSIGGYELLSQGQGAPTGTTSTFTSHLWPVGGYLDFSRFVFELECVRPAGCDRSNYNAVDANSFVFTLADESPSQVSLNNNGGPIMEGRWVRGNQTATYQFTELGSGIRREWIDIDGSERFTIDHASECDVDSNGAVGVFARQFQPCAVAPNPIGRSYGFDTASLPDGLHTLQACTQDFAQWQGYNSAPSASCDQRPIYTDNTPPGASSGLTVTSANAARYLPQVGAHWQLPPNQGSPISKIHYNIVNVAGEVVVPEQTVSGTNLSALSKIEGPSKAGDYRLRVWLEDEVGFQSPASTTQIPHDTTPPAAPQDVSVTPPTTSRSSDGFDLRWRDITDAGSSIDAIHYQVLDGSGALVVPTQTVNGDNPQSIANLDTPNDRGEYTLRLWLSDAEGNVGAPVSAPLTYDCVRSQVAGGTSLSAGFGPSGAGEEVVQEGNGSIISGSLRGAGGPTANAPLCVFSRVVTDPGREFEGIALSGRDGSYKFPVEAGPSRQLSVIYRPDNRELSAAATIQTVVHPTFKAHSRIVHNKHSAEFYGQIPGPHNDNVVVVLQARVGKGWLAFHRYRTRDNGKFVLGYHFNRTTSPTTYTMRAQVRSTVGYPYLQGNSRPLALRVLP